MKSKQEVLLAIQDILVDMFEIDREAIKPEARLYEDLDIDSIDAVDIIVKVKELTGKNLKPEAFKNVRTIDDIAEAVYSLVAE
jgi:acyl carrier protein